MFTQEPEPLVLVSPQGRWHGGCDTVGTTPTIMNTIFKTTALLLAAALPVAFSAESFGVTLPTALNTSHMFGVFVFALTLLTMAADYRKAKPLALTATGAALPTSKASLRLAA